MIAVNLDDLDDFLVGGIFAGIIALMIQPRMAFGFIAAYTVTLVVKNTIYADLYQNDGENRDA